MILLCEKQKQQLTMNFNLRTKTPNNKQYNANKANEERLREQQQKQRVSARCEIRWRTGHTYVNISNYYLPLCTEHRHTRVCLKGCNFELFSFHIFIFFARDWHINWFRFVHLLNQTLIMVLFLWSTLPSLSLHFTYDCLRQSQTAWARANI